MRRKKKARRGWRKKKRKPALASSIPGFVAEHIYCITAIRTVVPVSVPLALG
jgi:hypothetical protein